MNKKKIFGIGAVVIMILVAFAPAINGMQQKTTDENKVGKCLVDYDLEVTITNPPTLISDQPKIVNGKQYSSYYIEYNIKNNGPGEYPAGSPLTELFVTIDDEDVQAAYWYTNINKKIKVNEDRDFPKTFDILTSDDPDLDIERYFADHKITLDCNSGGGEQNYQNNRDKKRVFNFWKNSNEFKPTNSQILATTPFGYEEITREINGHEYTVPVSSKVFSWSGALQDILDLIDDLNIDVLREAIEELIEWIWHTIPSHFKNDRLGWVKDFCYYMSMLSVEVLIILLRFGQFISNTWDDFLVICDWIKDVCAFFGVLLSSGVPSGTLWLNMIDSSGKLGEAIINIATNAVIWGGKILDAVDALQDTFTNWTDWRATQPWQDKIRVFGRVDFLHEGEKVTVECRDQKYVETIPDDDRHDNNMVWFDFEATSEPMYGEKSYRSPHLCQIKVTRHSHEEEPQETMKILSYCFSGGSVYRLFQRSRSRELDDLPNNYQSLLEKIYDLLKDRPAIKFFNNLFSFLSKDNIYYNKITNKDIITPITI